MPALAAENVDAFAHELGQMLGRQAVCIAGWREGDSLDALRCGEREGGWV
jgi:uncharacterized membrane protein